MISDPVTVLSIKQPPQNRLITTENSTMFRCDANVSVNATIGFKIFNDEIVSNTVCSLISYIGVIRCDKIINEHTTELLCNYFQSNSVSCNFSVYDLTVNSSSVVTCFVCDDQNKVNNSAALYLNCKWFLLIIMIIIILPFINLNVYLIRIWQCSIYPSIGH